MTVRSRVPPVSCAEGFAGSDLEQRLRARIVELSGNDVLTYDEIKSCYAQALWDLHNDGVISIADLCHIAGVFVAAMIKARQEAQTYAAIVSTYEDNALEIDA